jgi:membrane protein
MEDRPSPLWRLLRLRLASHARHRAEVRRARRSLAAQLPTPLQVLRRDWRLVAGNVWRATNQNDLFLLAAAVAFFSFLSLFPALTLLVSLYGLFADPVDVSRQLQATRAMLPAGGFALVEGRLRALAESPAPSLGLSVAVSALFGLWSSMRGAKALIVACNRIYRRQERRGFLGIQGASFGLTAFGLFYATLAILLLVLLPTLLRLLPRAPLAVWFAGFVRWPLLALLMMLFVAMIYRIAPSRRRPEPNWVSWGSALATILWLLASALFTTYVAKVRGYSELYGALAGVAVTLVWLYLSAMSVLLGAELNVELRRIAVWQARAATRGAHAAGRDEPAPAAITPARRP